VAGDRHGHLRAALSPTVSARTPTGHAEPQTCARFVWAIIEAQGQRFIKDGKTLDPAQESLEELTAQAQTFALKRLPILKAIGIAAWRSRGSASQAARSAGAARAPPRRRRASHADASSI
jgi:hypothetical protein